MGLQEAIEKHYRHYVGREHRRTFAQFFTPLPVATVMAAFILDNPNCRTMLDPAAGLLGFSRATDDILSLINSGRSTALVSLIMRQVEDTRAQLLQAPALKAAVTKAGIAARSKAASEQSTSEPTSEEAEAKGSSTQTKGRELRFRSLFNKITVAQQQSKGEAQNEPPKLSFNERQLLATNLVAYPECLNSQDTWLRAPSLMLGLHGSVPQLYDPNAFSLSPRYHGTSLTEFTLTAPAPEDALTAPDAPSTTAKGQNSKLPLQQGEALPALALSGHSCSRGYRSLPTLPDCMAKQPQAGFRKQPTMTMVNYEIDPLIFGYAQESCHEHPFGFVNNRLKCCDYLATTITERYDGIICNPPYMAYRDFVQITGGESPAMPEDMPRRINTYTLFLLQSLKQLSPKGRCAYLIPYEFLNSSIGVKVKTELLNERSLRSVIIFKIPIFEGAITTTGLFLFDQAKRHQDIEFITITSLDELPALAVHLCPRLLADLPQPQLKADPYGNDSHAKRTARARVPPTPVAAAKAAQARNAQLKAHAPTVNPAAITAAVAQAPALLDCFTLDQLYDSGLLKSKVSQLEFYPPTQKLLGILTPERHAELELEPYVLSLMGQTVPYQQLHAERKWHNYYQGKHNARPAVSEQAPSANAPQNHWVKGGGHYRKLVDFIRVKRGIATGANEFFLFNYDEILQRQLSPQCFIPVLARANMAPYPILTNEDFVALAASGQRVFLLSPPAQVSDPNLLDYLQLGQERGINRRYLTSHRTPWYAMERRELAPLLISVFNRGSFNVIRNDAGVYNLTAFHSLFIQDPALTDLIYAYLLTPLASELIMVNRREYGRGLEKLEPMDIMQSNCINFYDLNINQMEAIRELLDQYEVIVAKARAARAQLTPQSLYQRALDHVMGQICAIFAELS